MTINCPDCGNVFDPTETAICPKCGRAREMEDGILILEHTSDDTDYPRSLHAILSRIEPRHFWFSGRRSIVMRALRAALGALPGRTLIDVGCGRGIMLVAAESAGMTTCGIDTQIEALRFARPRVTGLLVSTSHLAFPAQFDSALLCDVIEHVADDVALVRAVSDVLLPGGVVVVTVPAHPALWSAVDEAWGHRRRYTKSSLANVLLRADLDLVAIRSFGTLLLPAQALQRSQHAFGLPRGADAAAVIDHALAVPPEPLNAVLRLAMEFDGLLGGLSFMPGTSLSAVGRRKSP